MTAAPTHTSAPTSSLDPSDDPARVGPAGAAERALVSELPEEPALLLARHKAELSAKLAEVTQAADHVVALVQGLPDEALTTIETATGAAAALIDSRGGRLLTTATSPHVLVADEVQYRLGQGPAMTAWATQASVRVGDLAEEPRWPRWVLETRFLALRSVLSAPVTAAGRTVGVIQVYSATPAAFGTRAARLLADIGVAAGAVLVDLVPPADDRLLTLAFEQTIRKASAVQLATSIVMERFHVSAAVAHRLLAAEADRAASPVQDVARLIVESDARLDEEIVGRWHRRTRPHTSPWSA